MSRSPRLRAHHPSLTVTPVLRQITVQMPRALYEDLRRLAAEETQSLGGMVRLLIERATHEAKASR